MRACDHCGASLEGRRPNVRFCDGSCRQRGFHRDRGEGSPERALRRREGGEEIRHPRSGDITTSAAASRATFRPWSEPGAERVFPVMPGTSTELELPDDDGPRPAVRMSGRGSSEALRCLECGARNECACGAPRRFLPALDGGMSAVPTNSYESEPPAFRGEGFWIAVRYGGELISSDRMQLPDIVSSKYTLESGRKIDAAKTFDWLLARTMHSDLRTACLWELTKRKPSKAAEDQSERWVKHLRAYLDARRAKTELRLRREESLRRVLEDPDAALKELLDHIRHSDHSQRIARMRAGGAKRQHVPGARPGDFAPGVQMNPDSTRSEIQA